MGHRVCPWWIGWLLINPLRRFAHDPDRIVGPYLKPGMLAVDLGCAMGHFSLPMARMVGPAGRVVCIDVQAKMLAGHVHHQLHCVIQCCAGEHIQFPPCGNPTDGAHI